MGVAKRLENKIRFLCRIEHTCGATERDTFAFTLHIDVIGGVFVVEYS